MRLLKGLHKHHIQPRHAGGSDDPDNLVLLHPIDHAIHHLVRYKIYGNHRDLCAAKLLFNHQGLFASIQAEPYKRPGHAAKMRGKMQGDKNPMWGRKLSTQHRQKISHAITGVPCPQRAHPGNQHGKGNKGKKQDPEWREKRLSQLRGRNYQMTCPHCDKTGGRMMLRWHFNNCRLQDAAK